MKKKAFKISGIVALLLLAAFVALTLMLDGMVKSGIEEHGSELMQTTVSVDDVSISLFSGKGSLTGFTIQNPENFIDEPALYIQEVSMEIELSSLLTDEIHVEEIIIKSPELFFEQKGIGANLKTLNDNMDLTSQQPSEKTLIIDYLLVEDSRVKVSTTIDRERTAEVSMEEFSLTGIGEDGSNTIKQSIRQVVEPLLEKAIVEALKSGVTEQIENKVRDLFEN